MINIICIEWLELSKQLGNSAEKSYSTRLATRLLARNLILVELKNLIDIALDSCAPSNPKYQKSTELLIPKLPFQG